MFRILCEIKNTLIIFLPTQNVTLYFNNDFSIHFKIIRRKSNINLRVNLNKIIFDNTNFIFPFIFQIKPDSIIIINNFCIKILHVLLQLCFILIN